ncbi:GTP pyrophosphokinase [Mycobacteriaceae bacterium 1482268.1]|nr:GTP pyrophosphokinase [Mycobacteriaceae bacterium 1482268.1]
MHFVGLDLAWGENNQTGVAAIDADGRLLHVGAAGDDAQITAAIAPFTGGDCVVAFDAPLIVNNQTGHRPAETAFNRDFSKFDAGARPAFADKPELKNPRAARLAAAFDLDMDPASGAGRRAIEVYPHPATVVLFELDKTLKYKRGPFGDRQRELLKLMTLIEGLDDATPRLRANRSVSWVELRRRVEAATKPSQLDRDEDPVDAVLCAYIALYWNHRPDDVTIYGDVETGYILTPSLPPDLAPTPRRRVVPPPTDELHQRLSRLEELLAQAQLEARTIRERLYRM